MQGGGSDNQCSNQNLIWEFPDKCKVSCGKRVGYYNSRVSRDGGKTWIVITQNTLPEDLQEIWNFMLKKHGKNSCGRPNVKYDLSIKKGYIALRKIDLPNCKECKLVEVEVKVKNSHGMCHRGVVKTKASIKLMCGLINVDVKANIKYLLPSAQHLGHAYGKKH